MRRLVHALTTFCLLTSLVGGCHHVAGICDCTQRPYCDYGVYCHHGHEIINEVPSTNMTPVAPETTVPQDEPPLRKMPEPNKLPSEGSGPKALPN